MTTEKPNCDYSMLLNAISFAANKHRDQRRKDEAKTPYINHPISVSLLISEVGGVNDPEILAAAILHDTIEDTGVSADELESLFGPTVRRLVEEDTDDKKLPKEDRKNKQISHAAELSPSAVLIKLGDKISNIRDVTDSPPANWTIERRREYLDWAEAVISNCQKVNTAMELLFTKVLAAGRKKLLSGNRMERVWDWLDAHVRRYKTPQTVTLSNFEIDWESLDGSFQITLDDITVPERFKFALELSGKTTYFLPMFHSPLGVPASYAAIELTKRTETAIKKGLHVTIPPIMGCGIDRENGNEILPLTPVIDRIEDRVEFEAAKVRSSELGYSFTVNTQQK